MTILDLDALPAAANAEEALLLPPLIEVLRRRRWIRADSLVRTEVAWNGRRVDLAVCTRTGRTSAFELKIGSFHRVLEQAMYNRLSFDRSWIVVPEVPQLKNSAQARENGVGILVLRDEMQVAVPAALQINPSAVRGKLVRTIRKAIV